MQENAAREQQQMYQLAEALEQERRKSMVDEKRARDIERALN